jgi:heme exporter protein CcmB
MLKPFLLFLKKDLVIEYRHKEFFLTALSFALFIGVLIGLSVTNAFIAAETITRIFPTLFWLGAFFLSILSIGRSYACEERLKAPRAFQSDPNLVTAFFLAKITSACLTTILAHAMFLFTLSVLLNMHSLNIVFFLPLIVLYSIGFTTLGIFLTALTASAPSAATLFGLLILPLLFPLFFAASELTHIIISAQELRPLQHLLESPWLTLLALIDGIYIFIGTLLFPAAIKE